MSASVDIVSRDSRDRLGEGPLWVPDEQALYWVDILGQRLNRLMLEDGSLTGWALPEMTGWVIQRRNVPGFVAGMQSGIKALTIDPLTVAPIAGLPDEPAGNRMNDAEADAKGRIWAGTMPLGGDEPTGALYRLDDDGMPTRMDHGYHVANGPAITPDGRWLLHTDSHIGHVYRFALHDDGSLGSREIFIAFAPDWGSPDGMTHDADGGLWVAHWGGSRITRFDPAGKAERAIHLPASQITSMAFAGERLDRLFVTSASDGVDEPAAGALFEVDPGCRGLAPHKYAG